MKLYYAYVTKDLADYYEKKAREHGAIIVCRTLTINSKHDNPCYLYLVGAKEGIIDPKWEIKTESY